MKLTPIFREGITARSIPPENLPERLAFNFLGELTEIISKPGISKASCPQISENKKNTILNTIQKITM